MNYSPRTSQMAHRVVQRPSLVIIDLLPVQCLVDILHRRGWWLLPCPRFGFQQHVRKLRWRRVVGKPPAYWDHVFGLLH
jgi:hypothetical protein